MTLALDRGIQILAELGHAQGLTLSDISQRTGVPKSTTHRLLKRLCEQNLVRQNRLDQRYRSNVLLPRQTDVYIPPADQPLLDIACHYAESLTDQVLWPSDIFIPMDDRLFLVESTRALTRVHIPHCHIQTRVDVLHSAAGRVLLAYSDDAIAERYLAQVWQEHAVSSDKKMGFLRAWPSMRDRIRQQGYAFRAATYFGERESGDGLRAMAVPIIRDNTVRACMNLVWPKRYASEETFAQDYAKPLIEAAQGIALYPDK